MTAPTTEGRCALDLIAEEYRRADAKFPDDFRSAHEGFAILLEEVDELWDEVKGKRDPETMARMRKEAIQVGAMAVKFLVKIHGEVPPPRASGGGE